MADNKPCIPDMLPNDIEIDWEELAQPTAEATLEVLLAHSMVCLIRIFGDDE